MGNKNEFYTVRIIQTFFFQMSAHFNYVGYILHQHVKRSKNQNSVESVFLGKIFY